MKSISFLFSQLCDSLHHVPCLPVGIGPWCHTGHCYEIPRALQRVTKGTRFRSGEEGWIKKEGIKYWCRFSLYWNPSKTVFCFSCPKFELWWKVPVGFLHVGYKKIWQQVSIEVFMNNGARNNWSSIAWQNHIKYRQIAVWNIYKQFCTQELRKVLNIRDTISETSMTAPQIWTLN